MLAPIARPARPASQLGRFVTTHRADCRCTVPSGRRFALHAHAHVGPQRSPPLCIVAWNAMSRRRQTNPHSGPLPLQKCRFEDKLTISACGSGRCLRQRLTPSSTPPPHAAASSNASQRSGRAPFPPRLSLAAHAPCASSCLRAPTSQRSPRPSPMCARSSARALPAGVRSGQPRHRHSRRRRVPGEVSIRLPPPSHAHAHAHARTLHA